MECNYNMAVTLIDVKCENVDRVKEAANAEWPWSLSDWYKRSNLTYAIADGHFDDSETIDEFAQRLAKAIWIANGGYCAIDVVATELVERPYEMHSFDESDYRILTPPPEVAKDGPSAQGGHDG